MQPGLFRRCWIPPRPLAFIVVWLILVGFLWCFLWAFLWCFLGIRLVVWSCIQCRQLSDRHRIWQAASLAALALRKHRRNDWQKSWPDAELALAGARSWRQHR